MKFKDVEFSALNSHLLAGHGFVDVRAPIEFIEGHLPGSENLFLLSDDERARIGTCYKHSGREAAVQLGYKIVSGENRDLKIQKWQSYFEKNPQSIVYCARGGLRSKISSEWISELRIPGVELRRLSGGLKEARRLILQSFAEFTAKKTVTILTGMTGSAKTHSLLSLKDRLPVIDLEGLAHHRGSAFGAWDIPQPRQMNFENALYVEILRLDNRFRNSKSVLIEDESRTVGLCVVPEAFFQKIRSSPVVLIEEALEIRVQNIFKDYISETAIGKSDGERALQVFAKYKKSLQSIQRKLGGLRTQEIAQDLQASEREFVEHRGLDSNRVWIEKLLKYYYDPMYSGSLNQRDPKILFKGTRQEAEQYLLQEI